MSTAASSNAYTRHCPERGKCNKVIEIPTTATTAAVKRCNPPSIAQDDIPRSAGTTGLNRDTRIPSPTIFPAKPSCPHASEASCAPILRDQRSPLTSYVIVCRHEHVLISRDNPPRMMIKEKPQPTTCTCFQTTPG